MKGAAGWWRRRTVEIVDRVYSILARARAQLHSMLRTYYLISYIYDDTYNKVSPFSQDLYVSGPRMKNGITAFKRRSHTLEDSESTRDAWFITRNQRANGTRKRGTNGTTGPCPRLSSRRKSKSRRRSCCGGGAACPSSCSPLAASARASHAALYTCLPACLAGWLATRYARNTRTATRVTFWIRARPAYRMHRMHTHVP